MSNSSTSIDLSGQVAVVTGGYGVLGGSLAVGLACAGARVAILGRRREEAERKVETLRQAGHDAIALIADVLVVGEVRRARDELLDHWGQVDVLVNAAGGNVARARSDKISIFDIPVDAFDEVLRLNLHGTVVPSLAFGEAMAKQGTGSIVNISSMAALTVLTGVMGYSVAKAGIDNFTRWLAVELARKHGDGVRVNAIAPGFFVSTQNRAVLINEDGSFTDRAKRILAQTPMGRFGRPEELIGPVTWLCSSSASFVSGVVLPVDGGFSVFGGV